MTLERSWEIISQHGRFLSDSRSHPTPGSGTLHIALSATIIITVIMVINIVTGILRLNTMDHPENVFWEISLQE